MMHDKRVNVRACAQLLFHFRGHPWILLWAARSNATTPPPFIFFSDRTLLSLDPLICRIFISSNAEYVRPCVHRGVAELSLSALN
jgi:hypothetical protein